MRMQILTALDVVAMRADKLEGPWSQPFFVSPAYTRTFSTQSGFSWRIKGTKKTTYLYMADQVHLNFFVLLRYVN